MRKLAFLAGAAVGAAVFYAASLLIEQETWRCEECGNQCVIGALRIPD